MFSNGGGSGGGGFGNFNVKFDGPGGGFGGGGGGSGFEQMFGGGGFGGGGAGGGRRQQQQPRRNGPELFPKNDPSGIAPLGKSKFPDAKSKYIWVIIFYDNNNQECASIKPSLESFTSKVKGTFKVGAVNCKRSSTERKFCQEKGLDIDGDLPAFGVVVNGEFTLFEEGNKRGATSMKKLHDFAVEKIPFDRVHMINHPSVIDNKLHKVAKETDKLGSILLLTDKFETTSKYASLAYQYRDHFVFGESRAKALSMAQHFKLKKYPLLIAFIPKRGKSSEFDIVKLEDVKNQDIGKWIDSLVSKHGYKNKKKPTSASRKK